MATVAAAPLFYSTRAVTIGITGPAGVDLGHAQEWCVVGGGRQGGVLRADHLRQRNRDQQSMKGLTIC